MQSEINPYESPQQPSGASIFGERARAIIFVINFGASVTFGLLCITAVADSISSGGSPFALMGGLCCIGPTTAIAVGEWFLFVRKRDGLRRPLGFACGAVGAFAAFGLITNIAEALMADDSPPMAFWLVFGSVSAAITSYGFYCCWYRLRDRRPPESRDSGGIV